MRISIIGDTLIIVSMYLLIIYLCLPVSMIYLNSMLIRMIILFSAFSFVTGMAIKNKLGSLIYLGGLFFVTTLFWVIAWKAKLDSIVYVYYCFASLTFIFGGMVLYSSNNDSTLKRLFIFLTAIYFFTSITTTCGLQKYPLAVRELGRGSTYDISLNYTERIAVYRSMNIASWSQIYGMIFAIPTSLFIWKMKKNLFFLVFSVALIIMVFFSQVTFAVLLAVTLAFGVIFCGKRGMKTIVMSLFLLILALCILVSMEEILSFMIQVSDAVGLNFLSIKLTDLKMLLVYGSAVGDASARGELYFQSLRTFMRSPIIGLLAGGKRGLDSIGYHSDFFDILGTFGLVGLIIMIISIGKYFGFLQRVKTDAKRDLEIIMVGFVALFVFNPVLNSPQIFVGAFLYPLLGAKYCQIESKSKKRFGFRFQ